MSQQDFYVGNVKLLSALGQGGMGTVYLGHHEVLDEKFAVKLLPQHLAQNEEFVQRFMIEARSAAKIKHRNVIQVTDCGFANGYYYIIMEFVDGMPCDKYLAQLGRLPETSALAIVEGVALALEEAAKHGIVHRDIKPANIMLTSEGVPKLADLGLAKQVTPGQDSGLTRTGAVMGTPYYIAPEQARDASRADARSDIYSLGATLYHFLAGRVPFDGTSPTDVMFKHLQEPLPPLQDINPEVSHGCVALVERMMAKDPGDRFQSASELLVALRQVMAGAGTEAAAAPARRAGATAGARTAGTRPAGTRAAGTRPAAGRPALRQEDQPPSRGKPLAFWIGLGGAAVIAVVIAVVAMVDRKPPSPARQAPGSLAAAPQAPAAPAVSPPAAQPMQKTPQVAARTAPPGPPAEALPATEKTGPIAAWHALQFGMMFHFDIATFTGNPGAAPSSYAPTQLDVRQWVRTAKQAGACYAVLTTKHETGFCLWDSKEYDYDEAASPVKTDVVAEFMAACREEHIVPGLYYSMADARNARSILPNSRIGPLPYAFIERQVTELLTNYPGVAIQWLDASHTITSDERARIYRRVKQLSPECVVVMSGQKDWPTDVRSMCMGIPGSADPVVHVGDRDFYVPWEVVDTLVKSWFWNANAQPMSRDNLENLYRRTVGSGMHLLLNVPPDRTGRIPDDFVRLVTVSGPIHKGPAQASLAPTDMKPWLRTGADALGPWAENNLGMRFRWVPAGAFSMGSALTPETAQAKYGGELKWYGNVSPRQVTIRKGLWLQETEVTQAQWKSVMGDNPSKGTVGDQYPVDSVTWRDCTTLLRKLNETSSGYCLPSEAEWEYACRSGNPGEFCFGDDVAKLGDYAWYNANARGTAHPVATRKPNAGGFYDMHGNVWEWCRDSFRESIPASETDGEAWRGETPDCVIRGGSWADRSLVSCRSAQRNNGRRDTGEPRLGLRLARRFPGCEPAQK